ncbi:17056_t:CDS:2 [Dentiscutata erythropus]|uniref:17056_t:CDS:1 n=1 Tax=Dentiscutata erythropus TaxID=1348616 RepID=A0A9N9CFW8_9GLOM|nr:17056_t:CDS:2 [Dentiscutata erythropus]
MLKTQSSRDGSGLVDFNSNDELDFSADELDNSNSLYNTSTIHINPFQIIRSGLKNTTAVDNTMNYLRIRGRFLSNEYSASFDTHISLNVTSDPIKDCNLTNENNIRLSNNYDDDLLKSWQATILTRKRTPKIYYPDNSININPTKNYTLNAEIDRLNECEKRTENLDYWPLHTETF